MSESVVRRRSMNVGYGLFASVYGLPRRSVAITTVVDRIPHIELTDNIWVPEGVRLRINQMPNRMHTTFIYVRGL